MSAGLQPAMSVPEMKAVTHEYCGCLSVSN
jgi:hypothetical protein